MYGLKQAAILAYKRVSNPVKKLNISANHWLHGYVETPVNGNNFLFICRQLRHKILHTGRFLPFIRCSQFPISVAEID